MYLNRAIYAALCDPLPKFRYYMIFLYCEYHIEHIQHVSNIYPTYIQYVQPFPCCFERKKTMINHDLPLDFLDFSSDFGDFTAILTYFKNQPKHNRYRSGAFFPASSLREEVRTTFGSAAGLGAAAAGEGLDAERSERSAAPSSMAW